MLSGNVESSSVLAWTEVCKAESCPENDESSSALAGTELCKAESCPENVESSSALARTELCVQTKSCQEIFFKFKNNTHSG